MTIDPIIFCTMFGIDLSNSPLGLFSFLMVGAAFKLTALGWLRRKRCEKFECVGRVHALYSYPVKACAGVEIREADAGVLGLEYKGTTDRHLMVIKGGHMLNSKSESRLTLIAVTPQGHGDLRLDAPGMPSLILNMDKFTHVISCEIYFTEMDVIDCGDEASSWFNTFLQKSDLRLVYSAPHLTKRDSVNLSIPWGNKSREGDLVGASVYKEIGRLGIYTGDTAFPAVQRILFQTAFSYRSSYLVTSTSSLHDLNQRLDSPVSMLNFRPNIVIEGTPPYDEDTWVELKIGESLHLRQVDICRRCPIITLDPVTGVRNQDKQPLQKLKSYRCMPPYGSSPLFGVYCALEVGGHVKVGDSVCVIREERMTHPSLFL